MGQLATELQAARLRAMGRKGGRGTGDGGRVAPPQPSPRGRELKLVENEEQDAHAQWWVTG